MKISQAFRTAYRTVSEQKTEALKFLTVEIALTGICLSPLLFLTEKGWLQYLAAFCAPLWLLVKIPARLNAAAAMQDSLGEGKLFSLRLADPGNYGRKIGYAFSRLGLLILWSLPLIGALIFAWDKYSGDTDGLTVMNMIYEFGGQDMKTGVIRLLLILAGLLILAALGAGFHSGDRHAFVLEDKEVLKGKRLKVLLCRICSVGFLLPLIIAGVAAAMRYVPLLDNVSGVVSGDVAKPDTKVTLIILGIGGVLTLPLLPIRSMVTAAYVRGLRS